MGEMLTLRDLPRATRPGDVGVHLHADSRSGRTYIAMPYSIGRWSLGTLMPRFESRLEQDAIKRAGGRRMRSGLRTTLCTCARCEILIGNGYFDHEVYIEPYLTTDKKGGKMVSMRLICAENAVEHGLGPGYAVVAEHDWGEAETMARTINEQRAADRAREEMRRRARAERAERNGDPLPKCPPLPPLRRISGASLIAEHFDAAKWDKAMMLRAELAPAWQQYDKEKRERYRFLRRQWARSTSRRELWEARVLPEWGEYLYHRGMLHISDWLALHDKRLILKPDDPWFAANGVLPTETPTGCPDGTHLRPAECSTGYHEQLFPLDEASLFESFRAQHHPVQWSITDYLTEHLNEQQEQMREAA